MPSTEKILMKLMKLAAPFSYPASLEKLDIDDNEAVWTAYTEGYQPSPALTDHITADVVIIGGGYTGVSTAYHLSEKMPDKKIVLLEAKTLANGASGRNGGMMLNRMEWTESMDDDTLIRIYNSTNHTINSILSIIDQHQLDVNYRRDGSLIINTKAEYAHETQADVKRLQGAGIPVQYLSPDEVRQKVNLENIVGAYYDPNEGQLNGAQYIRALKPILMERGVQIFEHTPVTKITEGKTITVETARGSVKGGGRGTRHQWLYRQARLFP